MAYQRIQAETLINWLQEPVRRIIIVAGPRQVGKTTLVRRTLKAHYPSKNYHYHEIGQPTLPASYPSLHYADVTINKGVLEHDIAWLTQQWEKARRATDELTLPAGPFNRNETAPHGNFILVLDEIQKIPNWSEAVKGLWDADRALDRPMHVVLLGSAPLLIQQGLTESLAGRFELLRMTHWSFEEMNRAFDIDLPHYIYYGGYPGSIGYIDAQPRWASYMRDSLIEPNIRKDIFMMTRVDKKILLKNLFALGCHYSGQELSYNKMLGQLQGAGNTTTLAHYLELLTQAGLLAGIEKYANQPQRRRTSSPKLNVLNTALMSAMSGYSYEEARQDRSYWGRLVESAVGAHLYNRSTPDSKLYYWRDGHNEVDFVLAKGNRIIAIEVKSGTGKASRRGLDTFSQRFKPHNTILVGDQGVPLDTFLLTDPKELSGWFGPGTDEHVGIDKYNKGENFNLRQYRDKYKIEDSSPEYSRAMRERIRLRDEQDQAERALLQYIRNNVGDIEAGTANPGIFSKLASAYYGYFIGSTGDSPRERLNRFFRDDPELMRSVLNGLRRFIHRKDIPDVAEIFRVHMENKHLVYSHPYLAGMDELAGTGKQQALQMSEDKIANALAFYYADGTGEQPAWYKTLLSERPELVARVYAMYGAMVLRAGKKHLIGSYLLAFDEDHRQVARLAVLSLLESFRVRSTSEQFAPLYELLVAALRYADHDRLKQLTGKKVSLKSMDAAQRVLWLTVGLILDPAQFAQRLTEFVSGSESRINYLNGFLSCRSDHWSPLDNLPLNAPDEIKTLLAEKGTELNSVPGLNKESPKGQHGISLDAGSSPA
jgi:predicted AAA+ superfamily ATPase